MATVLSEVGKKEEDIRASVVKPEVQLFDALIDTSTGSRSLRKSVVHLHSDTVYILNLNFVREAGEQLIIDAGTLIKVESIYPYSQNTFGQPNLQINTVPVNNTETIIQNQMAR